MHRSVIHVCPEFVEQLPEKTTPAEVLEVQDSVLQRSACQSFAGFLHWAASPAHLQNQVNSYGRLITGEPIWGDAVLTSRHGSKKEAECFFKFVEAQHESVSNSGLARWSSTTDPGQNNNREGLQVMTSQISLRASMKSSQRQPFQSCLFSERDSARTQEPSKSLGSLSRRFSRLASEATQEDAHTDCPSCRACKISEANVEDQPSQLQSNPHGSQSSAVSDQRLSLRPNPHAWPKHKAREKLSRTNNDQNETFEPRKRLLHSIMGQASSIAWTEPAKSRCEARPKIDSGGNLAAETADSETMTLDVASCPESTTDQAQSSTVHFLEVESLWEGLPADLVCKIAATMPSYVVAQTMAQTCKYWRCTILTDKSVLRQLDFMEARIRIQAIAEGQTGRRRMGRESWFLDMKLGDKAARAGNVSACKAMGAMYDIVKKADEGQIYWRLAAKLGDPHAQLKYALACYIGQHGVVRDSEEAFRWFLKAFNNFKSQPENHIRNHALAMASLHLGMLYSDGEGIKQDQEAAVKYLREAAILGNKDAADSYGFLVRTGQYGSL